MLLLPYIIVKHGSCLRIVAVCLLIINLVEELLDACHSVLCLRYFRIYLSSFCSVAASHFCVCSMGFMVKFLRGPKHVLSPAMNGVLLLCALYSLCQGCSTVFASLIVGCHDRNHRITWYTVIIKETASPSSSFNKRGLGLVGLRTCDFWFLRELRRDKSESVCVLALVHVTSYVRSVVECFPFVNLISAMNWTLSCFACGLEFVSRTCRAAVLLCAHVEEVVYKTWVFVLDVAVYIKASEVSLFVLSFM